MPPEPPLPLTVPKPPSSASTTGPRHYSLVPSTATPASRFRYLPSLPTILAFMLLLLFLCSTLYLFISSPAPKTNRRSFIRFSVQINFPRFTMPQAISVAILVLVTAIAACAYILKDYWYIPSTPDAGAAGTLSTTRNAATTYTAIAATESNAEKVLLLDSHSTHYYEG